MIGDISSSSWVYGKSTVENRAREREVRRLYGYTDRDYVSVYTLPKGQKTKKYGSFDYRTVSQKENRLRRSIAAMQGRIADAQAENLPRKEKAKKIARLQQEMKCLKMKLCSEMNGAPRVAVIVLEEEA